MHFHFHVHALEKEMAPHSSVLAWRIPGTGEPDGLPSMGLHRVRHDWSDLAAAAAHQKINRKMSQNLIILNCPWKETQMCRADFWTLRERKRVGWFGRMALKHVYYHARNESPVYVRYRIQDAWGWCMRMTQRDVMGRDVGEGFMFGKACTPVVDSCQWMAKPIQCCKVKK